MGKANTATRVNSFLDEVDNEGQLATERFAYGFAVQQAESTAAQEKKRNTHPSNKSFFLLLALALILDGLDMASLGTISLIVGIPANIVIIMVMVMSKGWKNPLLNVWQGGALLGDSLPIFSFLPLRTAAILSQNLDKIRAVTEKLAGVAKYFGAQGRAVAAALTTTSRVVGVTQTVKEGDWASAAAQTTHVTKNNT